MASPTEPERIISFSIASQEDDAESLARVNRWLEDACRKGFEVTRVLQSPEPGKLVGINRTLLTIFHRRAQ